jgi:hypothetical protein
MKEILKNNEGTQIILGFWAILIIAILLIVGMVAIFAFWGTLGFIGLLLLILGFYFAWKHKKVDQITIALLIAGIAMILIGQYTDLEILKFANPLKAVLGI